MILNTIGAIEYFEFLSLLNSIEPINPGLTLSGTILASLYLVITTPSVALPREASSRTTLFARRAAPLLIFIEAWSNGWPYFLKLILSWVPNLV